MIKVDFLLTLIVSYVLTGTERGMQETFGTTCHGAVSFVQNLSTSSFNFSVCFIGKEIEELYISIIYNLLPVKQHSWHILLMT